MSFFTNGVVDVWCGGCLMWWMSGVVDVWCGGCHILPMVWWMSSVVDVWCGGCRSINSNLHVPLSTTADPLAHAVQDA